LVAETIHPHAAGDAVGKDTPSTCPAQRTGSCKNPFFDGQVVVPNELKEAYKHVRAMLHQARSIELIDKNTVLLALQKLIASIAKVLGEIEAEKSDMETKKKEMGGLELIEEVEVTSAT
jgi:hypothetical protein